MSSILDTIKVCDDIKRPRTSQNKGDPRITRRNKYIEYLGKQRELIKTEQSSSQQAQQNKKSKKKITKAYFIIGDEYYVQTRYGTKPVIITDGKSTCCAGQTLDDVIVLVDKLIQATDQGELDDALAIAAQKAPRATPPTGETGAAPPTTESVPMKAKKTSKIQS